MSDLIALGLAAIGVAVLIFIILPLAIFVPIAVIGGLAELAYKIFAPLLDWEDRCDEARRRPIVLRIVRAFIEAPCVLMDKFYDYVAGPICDAIGWCFRLARR